MSDQVGHGVWPGVRVDLLGCKGNCLASQLKRMRAPRPIFSGLPQNLNRPAEPVFIGDCPYCGDAIEEDDVIYRDENDRPFCSLSCLKAQAEEKNP